MKTWSRRLGMAALPARAAVEEGDELWLRADTRRRPEGGTAVHLIGAMAGLANVDTDRNGRGSQFDCASWQAFGRLQGLEPTPASGREASALTLAQCKAMRLNFALGCRG